MSERYNPRKLKRDWVARLAAGEKPIDARKHAIESQEDFERRRALRSLRGEIRDVVNCRHDMPWLNCTLCSKPRSRP